MGFALTSIGLSEYERRENTARQDVAVTFLDTLAGLVSDTLQDHSRSDLADILRSASRFKHSIGNEAVALCCYDGVPIVATLNDDAEADMAAAALVQFLHNIGPASMVESQILMVPEQGTFLVARSYEDSTGQLFQLAAAFDLLFAQERLQRMRRSALAVDIGFAILSAIMVLYSYTPVCALSKN